MGFTVPAVQYSALATLPPELTSSKSQHSIAHTTNVRVILNQILKKLLNNNNNIIHNEQTITTELYNKIPVDLSENIDNKENDVSIVSKTPNDNSSGHQISIEKEPMKSIPSSLIEPLERLPFSEPYLSKPRRIPLELSTYHKHCIHQEKYIDQKQYHPLLKQIKPNSSLSSYIKENCSNLANFRLKNSVKKNIYIIKLNEYLLSFFRLIKNQSQQQHYLYQHQLKKRILLQQIMVFVRHIHNVFDVYKVDQKFIRKLHQYHLQLLIELNYLKKLCIIQNLKFMILKLINLFLLIQHSIQFINKPKQIMIH